MERIKCVLSYDGTYFSGYQIQQEKRTVQQELESVLQNMHKGEHIRIYASGRTDAGVHAQGQVIHFDSPLSLPAERWAVALNALLPEDIAIKHADKVNSGFHARFDVVSKEYRYRVLYRPEKDVFRRHHAFHYPYPLNLQAMRSAAAYLIGTHDFTSFCSAKTEVDDKIRTIYELELLVAGDELLFRFVGDGFLYNMVRIIVGTLLQIGQGKMNADDIPMILEKRDRRFAGKTAPGHGLYLWQVNYNN